MKPRLRFACLSTVALVLAVLAPSPASEGHAAHFVSGLGHDTVPSISRIQDLNPGRNQGMWPVGVNDRGQVVGDLTASGNAFIETRGRVSDLGVAPGYTGSQALGISDRGVVLAESFRGSTADAFFTVDGATQPAIWKKLRSGLPNYVMWQAVQIDSAGDVIGTLRHVGVQGHVVGARAAIWVPGIGHRYAQATLFPLMPGYSGSDGTAVWRGGGRLVAAGCTHPTSANPNACMALWTQWRGLPFRMAFGVGEGGIEAVGGRNGKAYAEGTDGSFDVFWGWGARVRFDRAQRGTVAEPSRAPRPPGAGLIWGWSAVTADVSGRLVAIGSNDAAQNPAASVWIKGRNPLKLQSLLGPTAPWTLQSAVAINNRGQILGNGRLHAHGHAYLLTGSF